MTSQKECTNNTVQPIHCNTLRCMQHSLYNTLQHTPYIYTATHSHTPQCNTLQCMQHTATLPIHCNTPHTLQCMQHTCNTLPKHCNTLHHSPYTATATHTAIHALHTATLPIPYNTPKTLQHTHQTLLTLLCMQHTLKQVMQHTDSHRFQHSWQARQLQLHGNPGLLLTTVYANFHCFSVSTH